MPFVPENKNPSVLTTAPRFALRPEDIDAHHHELAHLRGSAAVKLVADIANLIVARFNDKPGAEPATVCGGCLSVVLNGVVEHIAMEGGLNRKEAVTFLRGGGDALNDLADAQDNKSPADRVSDLLNAILGGKQKDEPLQARYAKVPDGLTADALSETLSKIFGAGVKVVEVDKAEFDRAAAAAVVAEQGIPPSKRTPRRQH